MYFHVEELVYCRRAVFFSRPPTLSRHEQKAQEWDSLSNISYFGTIKHPKSLTFLAFCDYLQSNQYLFFMQFNTSTFKLNL